VSELVARVGPSVLYGHSLRLASRVATHLGLHDRRLLGLRVEADSIFDVAWVIYVVIVFLVNIARVGLLERACAAVRAVTHGLLGSDCLRVVLPSRICVSDSVVHLLKAFEHQLVGLFWGFFL